VSTSRHISQGAHDLTRVDWHAPAGRLSGASRTVAGDTYEIAVAVPSGFALDGAEFAGRPAEIERSPGLVRMRVVPERTGTLEWKATFQRD
jgi:hypothetical protein